MSRIINVQVAVRSGWEDDSLYIMEVYEIIRSAKPRLVSSIMVGHEISSDNVDLAVQLVEDTLRSAIGRTIGVHDQLPF